VIYFASGHRRGVVAGLPVRACFTGANLPCVKMNIARDNEGPDAFCRSNPNAPGGPAFASGHDSIYAYRCRGRRAEVESTIFPLDARGFAATRFGLPSSTLP
jgi:hypothetical protein